MHGEQWVAPRCHAIEISGVRRVFDLARELTDPVDLSIGQPHFPVPEAVRRAAADAVMAGRNGYTQSQGIRELRERIAADLRARFGAERPAFVTSGTNGGLLLALMATVSPGDEVILFDPYFVAYPHMVTLAGGTQVVIDTYPDFGIDLDRVRDAISPRTKAILVGSPSNPTGAVLGRETLRDLALLAREKGVLLISDEIYRAFCYDGPAASPAEFSDEVLVVEGFGKTYGITGWRLGFAHGPRAVIEEMIKLQQFTFICAPAPAQYAGVVALDTPMDAAVADYRRKRDRLYEALAGRYDVSRSGGAFYLFPASPGGEGEAFVKRAIGRNLLIIPGGTFSRRDTHFRVSYAADDAVLDRGIAILRELAG